jgi:hypothetical protein
VRIRTYPDYSFREAPLEEFDLPIGLYDRILERRKEAINLILTDLRARVDALPHPDRSCDEASCREYLLDFFLQEPADIGLVHDNATLKTPEEIGMSLEDLRLKIQLARAHMKAKHVKCPEKDILDFRNPQTLSSWKTESPVLDAHLRHIQEQAKKERQQGDKSYP